MKTTIYFVRHGEYENPQQILPSRLAGFPLSAKGKSQIEKVSRLLLSKKIAAVYASPILRTKQSGQLLSHHLKIPLYFSKSIQEVDTPLQGQHVSVTHNISKYGDSFVFPPHRDFGGETLEHIYLRVDKFVKKICEKYPGKSVICVSHGDPMMAYHIVVAGNKIDLTHRLMDYDEYVPKGGVIQIDFEDGRYVSKRKLNY